MNEKNGEKTIAKVFENKMEYTRFVQFPSDDHFNGKSLIYQLELSSEDYCINKNTLVSIMKVHYNLSKRYFPVSIPNNFEKGISKETVFYPKLNYSFQLFENSYSKTSHETIHLSIKKEMSGEFTIE